MEIYIVDDVMKILHCSKSTAYKMIRIVRNELKQQGYLLPPAGKVPKNYFDERIYKSNNKRELA